MIDFIRFVGQMFDKKYQELGLEDHADTVNINIYLNPTAIIGLRENVGNDGEIEGCVIYLSSGESFWVEQSTEEVMNKLNIFSSDERVCDR